MSTEKKLYWSPAVGGFKRYPDGKVPPDAILVTEKQRDLLIAAEKKGKRIVARDGKVVAEVIPVDLDEYKARAKERMNLAIKQSIEKGFPSDALGTTHFYRSTLEDQSNLTGLKETGMPMPLRCTDEIGRYTARMHNPEQIAQVFFDGVAYKLGLLGHGGVLKAQIFAATSVEEVDAVTWDDAGAAVAE